MEKTDPKKKLIFAWKRLTTLHKVLAILAILLLLGLSTRSWILTIIAIFIAIGGIAYLAMELDLF
jgi:hypothetical protein